MKKLKKVIAVMASVGLCLSFSGNAFAADQISNTKEKSLNKVIATTELSQNIKDMINTDASKQTNGINLQSSKYDVNTNVDVKKQKHFKFNTKNYSSKNSKKIAMLQASEIPSNTTTGGAVTINDTIENSKELTLNTEIKDNFSSTNKVLWYKINSNAMKKLTIYLIGDNNITFYSNIYDSNSNYITGSQNSLYGNLDSLSFISQGGYYYIGIESENGTGDFSILALESNNYSQNEPNDSYYQPNEYDGSINTTDTFDNSLDQDWSKLNITEDGTYKLSIAPVNSSSSFNNASIYMVNDSTGDVSQISQSPYTLSLQKGSYHFCVSGSMSNTTDSYRFTVTNNNDLTVSKVEISNIEGCNKVDYGYGSFWRISDSMTLHGKAYNSKGTPITNTPVIIAIAYKYNTGFPTWTRTASAQTDSNGNFQVTIADIPHAYSDYSALVGSTVQFVHYFDIIPIMFFDGNNAAQVNCADQWLYHFALSDYIGGL